MNFLIPKFLCRPPVPSVILFAYSIRKSKNKCKIGCYFFIFTIQDEKDGHSELKSVLFAKETT